MKSLTAFDRLDEVRSAARARAVEDFEFFCSGVLGLKVPSDLAQRIQNDILQEPEIGFQYTQLDNHTKLFEAQLNRAIVAWRVVLGLSGVAVQGPSETFEWLFPEVARRAA